MRPMTPEFDKKILTLHSRQSFKNDPELGGAAEIIYASNQETNGRVVRRVQDDLGYRKLFRLIHREVFQVNSSINNEIRNILPKKGR